MIDSQKFSSVFPGNGYPGTRLDAPEVEISQDLLIGHLIFASILLPNTYPDFEGSRVSVMEAHLNAPGSCESTRMTGACIIS